MIVNNYFKYGEKINDLISNSFNGLKIENFSSLLFSSIILENNHIIGHAAIQKRRFHQINNINIKSYLLGLVCVKKNYQKQGIGTQIIQEILNQISTKDEFIILLNCGENITKFYEKIGFTILSNRSSYIRENQVQIDDDPVMGLSNCRSNIEKLKQHDVVFLGLDF